MYCGMRFRPTQADLKKECKHHGLSSNGKKTQLLGRLTKLDEQLKTRTGVIVDYQRRLKLQEQAKLASIVFFSWFSNFQEDIRLLIWEDSLPCPRTLCPGEPNPSTSELVYPPSGGNHYDFAKHDRTRLSPPTLNIRQTRQYSAFAKSRGALHSKHIDYVSRRQTFMRT